MAELLNNFGTSAALPDVKADSQSDDDDEWENLVVANVSFNQFSNVPEHKQYNDADDDIFSIHVFHINISFLLNYELFSSPLNSI